MANFGTESNFGLENHGIRNCSNVYWNLTPAELVEQILARREGVLTASGAVMVNTGIHTGRSPNDKFVVDHQSEEDKEIWWGKVNQPISVEKFETLYLKVVSYLQNRDVFVQDMMVGAHPEQAMPIRVVSELAYASLFSRNLFIRVPQAKAAELKPEFTVIHCPLFLADPAVDGTRTSTFIIVDFARKVVVIGGTSYAGEIKKSIFTVLNYTLPRKGILSMHCSANVGARGDVALFFGLSGTGKTTLSSDPERKLIGDDEHGWSDDSIFNFEGGCYAKTINLQKQYEPIIWEATQQFGTVLENVVIDPKTRIPNFDDGSLTENTRAAYPLDFITNKVDEGYAGIPENVFFLTADAFGVMPPLARLTPEQAQYYFLSGYTSKLAGTEKGLGKEPEATYSTCFGSPFLPLPPRVYAKLLGEKVQKQNVKIWLLNTGWTGGSFGIGKRMSLPFTRAMIRAVLTKQLDHVEFVKEEFFGLWIPTSCPEVPPEILNPIQTWSFPAAYTRQANDLAKSFKANFAKIGAGLPQSVIDSGPQGKE